MSLKLYSITSPDTNTSISGIKIISNPKNTDIQTLTYVPSMNGITSSSVLGPTGPTGPAAPAMSFCVRGKYSGGPYIKVDPSTEWSAGGPNADGLLAPFVYHEYTDFPITNPLIDSSDLLFIAPVAGIYNISISYSKIPTSAGTGRVLVIHDIVHPVTQVKYSTEIIDFDNTSTELYRNQFGSWSQNIRLPAGATVRPYQHENYLNNGPEYINFSGSLIAKI